MKRRLAFVHTSPAAIPPLAGYYKEHAPEFEITNLLDDGLLRLFAAGDEAGVTERLEELLRYALRRERVELALITCSAVTRPQIASLHQATGIPVVKIDDPLAEQAAAAGARLGVVISFPPTRPATEQLLRDALARRGLEAQLTTVVVPEAFQALLNGDAVRHDRLLIEAVDELRAKPLDAVVLAQVSMASLLPLLQDRPGIPVLSSLPASLEAIREALRA